MEKRSTEQHIQSLHRSKASCDANSTTLANTLENEISTGFRGQQKYFYELLQNADDAAAAKVDLVVKFKLLEASNEHENDYLIFSHSGQHFTAADVEKISDNAARHYQRKAQNANNTGYKGVGFKAIYSIADAVTILSREYTFSFDKDYPQWKNTKGQYQAYPWPIIPIWTPVETLPVSIRKHINSEHVNFIIRLKKNINMQEEFKAVLAKPEMILFLRSLRCLEVENENYSHRIELNKEQSMNILDPDMLVERLSISENGMPAKVSFWTKYNVEFSIPVDIKQALQSFDDHQCPARLKLATSTRITFVAELDQNYKLIPLQNTALFAYLPTQVTTNLPYFVNADFLLNPPRSELQANIWNEKLFSWIAYYQFLWFSKLAVIDKFRLQVLTMLVTPEKFSIGISSYKEIYRKSYEQAITQFAFVPGTNINNLLFLKEAKYDLTGFYNAFPEQVKDEKLAAHALLNIETLKEQIQMLNLEHICNELIYKLALQNKTISFQLRLYAFLRDKDLKLVSETAFVLTRDGKLVPPKQIYFDVDDVCLLSVLKLDLLNVELERNKNFKSWLMSLGAKPAKRVEIIRGYILNAITNKQLTPENIISITHYVLNAFLSSELSGLDLLALRLLPVLTIGNQLLPAERSYFSSAYNPNLNLQSLINDDVFISPIYLANDNSEENISRWRNFFKAIKVIDEIQFSLIETYPLNEALLSYPDAIKKYYKSFVFREKKLQKIQNIDIEKEGVFINFHNCNLLQNIGDASLSSYFWPQLAANWAKIKGFKKTKLRVNDAPSTVNDSFLAFMVRNTACVNGSLNKNMYKPGDIYSTKYQALSAYVNVANIHVELSNEQATYCGFKTQLAFEDIVSILFQLAAKKTVDIKAYELALYDLCAINKFSPKQRKMLANQKIMLPVQNQTLSPLHKIYCFAIEGKMPPANSNIWLREFPGFTREELIYLSGILNIPVIRQQDLSFSTQPALPIADMQLKNTLLLKLPFIARIQAYVLGKNETEVIKELCNKLSKLKIFSAKKLSYCYMSTEVLSIYTLLVQSEKLIFKHPWNSIMVIDSLIQTLANYFELPARTSALLKGVLMLEGSELTEWFEEHGFSSQNLPKVPENSQIVTQEMKPPRVDIPTVENAAATTILTASSPQAVTAGDNVANSDDKVVNTRRRKNQYINVSPKASESSPVENSVNTIPVTSSSLAVSASDSVIKSDDKVVNMRWRKNQYITVVPKVNKSSAVENSAATTILTTSSPQTITASSGIVKSDDKVMTSNPLSAPPKANVSVSANNLNNHQAISQVGVNQPNAALEVPLISVKEIDLNKIKLIPASVLKNNTQAAKNLTASFEIDSRIGFWGEELIYYKLLAHYKTKYSKFNFKATYSGFTLTQGDQVLKVIWHNKHGESGVDRDFTIIKKNIERYIEVKSTTNAYLNEMHVTAREHNLLNRAKERYRFFRVANCGTKDAYIDKIKNPAAKLANGQLELSATNYVVKMK